VTLEVNLSIGGQDIGDVGLVIGRLTEMTDPEAAYWYRVGVEDKGSFREVYVRHRYSDGALVLLYRALGVYMDEKDPVKPVGRARGTRIKEFRKKAQLTSAQLAKQAGISRSYMSEIERGARGGSNATLQRLAAVLGCDPVDLLP
jgi:DNA-binding XRE family transcriptional regulator